MSRADRMPPAQLCRQSSHHATYQSRHGHQVQTVSHGIECSGHRRANSSMSAQNGVIEGCVIPHDINKDCCRSKPAARCCCRWRDTMPAASPKSRPFEMKILSTSRLPQEFILEARPSSHEKSEAATRGNRTPKQADRHQFHPPLTGKARLTRPLNGKNVLRQSESRPRRRTDQNAVSKRPLPPQTRQRGQRAALGAEASGSLR